MSPYYYKYNFISPHKLYARVQEEMRSYFATQAIDNLMFPIWTEDCIQKFRNTFYPIKETFLCLDKGKALLPEDFKGVREVWATTTLNSPTYNLGASTYYPKDYQTVTMSDSVLDEAGMILQTCNYTLTHKVRKEEFYTYNLTHLLTPGHIEPELETGVCPSRVDPTLYRIFDVRDEHIITHLDSGNLHILYYADGVDEDGYQMIPDNFFMQDYIRKYLIYMLFKQIFNQTTDETFNQVAQKMEMAKADMYHALTLAENDAKSETQDKRIRKIRKSYTRNNKYRID